MDPEAQKSKASTSQTWNLIIESDTGAQHYIFTEGKGLGQAEALCQHWN